MNRHDEKEKLMEEILGGGKKDAYTGFINNSKELISSTENELNRILLQNQKDIEELTKQFNYSDDDLNKLKTEIEKDFNVKIDAPETVVTGKASKEIFDEINRELKEVMIGQDDSVDAMTTALRRPYVIGSDPAKIRNTILVYGSNGTGRHMLVTYAASFLKKHGLSTAGEVYSIDMSRYQSQSQEILFLQDIYVALNGKNPIIMVENFEEASPIFVRMIGELVTQGKCNLNQRYTFVNNQLQEATSKLSKDIIDHLDGNDKIIVFVSEKNPGKLTDVFGKSVIDAIVDRVGTVKLSEEEINEVTIKLLGELVQKCAVQLELVLNIDLSVNDYLKSVYEPNNGMDSLSPVTKKIYDELVNVVLKNDEIKTVSLTYEDGMKATVNENEVIQLKIADDTTNERAEIQAELDDIVGLKEVKDYLLSLENQVLVNQIRKQKGLKTTEVSKHMIFTGNPGTGKTTIARIVSRMMKACGILKQGQLVEVTRADLVGKYVGHTAPLTMDVINSAMGGVLFIDEAYSLYRGKDDSFGLECIDTLVKAMEDHRDDLIVILAGYTKEMKTFLEANSGLKSRFANVIEFDDYTGEELMQITKSIAKGKDYRIDAEAEKPLTEYFTMIQAKNDPNSGNGRLARNLVEAAILKQSKRLLDNPDAEMDVLLLEDFDLTDKKEDKQDAE